MAEDRCKDKKRTLRTVRAGTVQIGSQRYYHDLLLSWEGRRVPVVQDIKNRTVDVVCNGKVMCRLVNWSAIKNDARLCESHDSTVGFIASAPGRGKTCVTRLYGSIGESK